MPCLLPVCLSPRVKYMPKPGTSFVDTPLTHRNLEEGVFSLEIENTVLKRPARPEEIADAVLFLTSRMGSYMCAGALVVDGGYTA